MSGLRVTALSGWGHTAACWQDLDLPHAQVEARALPGLDPAGPAPHAYALDAALPGADPAPDLLVGWSLGGLAVWAAVENGAIRPRGLVLVATPPTFPAGPANPDGLDPATLADFRHGLATDPTATLRRFYALQFRGDTAPRSRWGKPALRDRLLATDADPDALLGWLDRLTTADFSDHALPDIPVLVVQGEQDAVVAPAASRRLRACGSDVRHHIIPGAGHAPHISHPQAFGECLAGFARTLPA